MDWVAMQWVAVAVGVIFLIALHVIRFMLAVVYPCTSAAISEPPDPQFFGGLDLLETLRGDMERAGFSDEGWIRVDHDDISRPQPVFYALFHNSDLNSLALVGPAMEVNLPNQLLMFYVTPLAEHRYAITQVSNPYFESVDDPLTPAQTIAPRDTASELACHREFVTDSKEEIAIGDSNAVALHLMGEHFTDMRTRLIHRGRLKETDGIARPTVRQALRTYRKLLKRPRSDQKPSQQAPTSRLSFFAGLTEHYRTLAPTPTTQRSLMLLSSVMFLAVGWPVFGLELSAILLVVILIHEGGHWLAMKLFGYSNPHITLLPLLGGVAMGHENDPNATKRVWVSLAGPLPGILIGWALLLVLGLPVTDMPHQKIILMSAIVFLFVNYLNLLPVPPLDGYHVLQAILPKSWTIVQIVLLVAGVVGAFLVAWAIDFWPLALIAGLQALGIRGIWERARLAKTLSTMDRPDGDDAKQRDWLFDVLRERLGEPDSAAKRIGLANALLSQLKLRPMPWQQRFLVALVFVGTFALPLVLVGPTLFDLGQSRWRAAERESHEERLTDSYGYTVAAADSQPLDRLLDYLVGDDPRSPPASAATIDQLRTTMGRLPIGLAEYYQFANGGVTEVGIGPIEQVRPVDEALFTDGDLADFLEAGPHFFQVRNKLETINLSRVRNWWLIGEDSEWGEYVFTDPTVPDDYPEVYWVTDWGVETFDSVDRMIRERWVAMRYAEIEEEIDKTFRAELMEELRDSPTQELLARMPRPSLLVRLAAGETYEVPPASDDAIAALATRMNTPIPEDLRTLWTDRYGRLSTGLFAPEDVLPGTRISSWALTSAQNIAKDVGVSLSTADVQACWIMAGRESSEPCTGDPVIDAQVLWCPAAPNDVVLIDLMTMSTATDINSFLKNRLIEFR